MYEQFIIYGVNESALEQANSYIKDLSSILYACDSDSQKWGKQIQDWTIFPPIKIKENPDATILILCASVKEIAEGLKAMGIFNKIITYPWFRRSYFQDHHAEPDEEVAPKNKEWMERNEENLLNIYHLQDLDTNDILREVIRQRKMLQWEFIEGEKIEKFSAVYEYFYDDTIAPLHDVTFIDGGAYTGDSIEGIYHKYGERLKQCVAFEPDTENMKKLTENMKINGLSGKVKCFPYGMSDQNRIIYFSGTGNSGNISEVETDSMIEVKMIDSCDFEIYGDLMIKMDVEGSELSALKGAKETIKKYTPYLSICLYHEMEDVLQIPQYIKSINQDYDFYIRGGGHIHVCAVPKARRPSI